MAFVQQEPGHWTCLQGIITLKRAANPTAYDGGVVRAGNSREEQIPEYLPAFSNLPPVPGYPATSASNTLNAGFMGIGLADLYTALQQVIPAVRPGRIIIGDTGINDCLTSLNHNNTDFINWFAATYHQLVAYCITAVGGAQYVLVETMAYALDGAHDNDLVDALNNQIRYTYFSFPGLLTLDLVPLMFNADRTEIQQNMLCSDRVHLGGPGVAIKTFAEQNMFTVGHP